MLNSNNCSGRDENMVPLQLLLWLVVVWNGHGKVTSTPIQYSGNANSRLLQDVERRKALYYNRRQSYPTAPEIQSRVGEEEQTSAQDRLFIKPYKFPFWGLPYGIYSKGGFFNPGLFPFVPGGPGFPPYDGVFGSPWGPGVFPGPNLNPFQQHTTPAPPTPPPTPHPPPSHPPDPHDHMENHDAYDYYYVKRKPKRRRPRRPRPQPQQYERYRCPCAYPEDEEIERSGSSDEGNECVCSQPKEAARPRPRPYRGSYSAPSGSSNANYGRPKPNYRNTAPKKTNTNPNPYQAPNRRPCRYGYRSGPYGGGCRQPPPPPKEERSPECMRKIRGRCVKPRYRYKPKPVSHYPDDDEDDGSREEDEEANEEEEEEEVKMPVYPQYIPVYVPVPYHDPSLIGSPGPYAPSYMYNNSQPPDQTYGYGYQPSIQSPEPPTPYPQEQEAPSTTTTTTTTSTPQPSTKPPTELPPIIIHYMPVPPPTDSPKTPQYTAPQNPTVIYSDTGLNIHYEPQPQPDSYPSFSYAGNNDNETLMGSESSNVPMSPIQGQSQSQVQLPFDIVYKPQQNGFLYKPEIRYKPHFQTATTPKPNRNGDRNLRVMNSEEPFIANHLNNYTSSSFQIQKHNDDNSRNSSSVVNHRNNATVSVSSSFSESYS